MPRLRLTAIGLTVLALSACKYQADGSPAASPSTPTRPATPAVNDRADAPQVSSSGPLTLERYADTTSAVGGAATSSQYSLVHEESKP